MTNMPVNKAAYVEIVPNRHLDVRDSPYTRPGPGQVVVHNRAIAINPIDHMLPIVGAFQHLKWPFVVGSDSAGDVVEVGSGVTRFRVGDRVVGQAIGYDEHVNNSAESSFQQFTILREAMTARIPDRTTYDQACVLPLGIGTAASALFQADALALQRPSPTIKSHDKGVVIIWGGSTSVGSCAIQLAVAAGYEAVVTCSPHNFEYCLGLGASQCFDYSAVSVRTKIADFMKGKTLAGALSIAPGGVEACFEIFDKCQGNKFIAVIAFPKPPGNPQRFVIAQTMYHFLKFMLACTIRGWRKGVRWGFVNGTTLAFNGVGEFVFGDYLGQALENGTFQCAPKPMVVGHGLEKIQHACDVLEKGVSAAKVVVTL